MSAMAELDGAPWYGRNDGHIADALKRPGWFEARVLSKIRMQAGCWIWTASTSATGHGRVKAGPVQAYAHRVVWISMRGRIPAGMVLDHDGPGGCHNRACVNPDHLAVATNRENTTVTASAGVSHEAMLKTACPAGHPLVKGNLVAAAARRGKRSCLTCNRDRTRLRDVAVRSAAQSLGMTRSDYLRSFGQSVHTASNVLGGTSTLVPIGVAS